MARTCCWTSSTASFSNKGATTSPMYDTRPLGCATPHDEAWAGGNGMNAGNANALLPLHSTSARASMVEQCATSDLTTPLTTLACASRVADAPSSTLLFADNDAPPLISAVLDSDASLNKRFAIGGSLRMIVAMTSKSSFCCVVDGVECIVLAISLATSVATATRNALSLDVSSAPGWFPTTETCASPPLAVLCLCLPRKAAATAAPAFDWHHPTVELDVAA
mmetsp:Transcript_3556/g.12841  ORF Transcript_3556/g.12841 Transcript_3556/m.12841 type:complete len:222 (-) Transcript_3556:794-1459(-)